VDAPIGYLPGDEIEAANSLLAITADSCGPPPQPQIDLDIIKTDGAELSDASEESPGGYVPVNNDNDDYDFTSGTSQILDKDDTNGVTGENDFVQLSLHHVTPGASGAKYRLVFTSSKIKIWSNANRTNPVTSNVTEFDANVDTTVYVEGVSKGDSAGAEVISITYIQGGTTIADADRVNFTVYEVTGPTNVPGYTIYTYNGDIPGGGTGSWIATDGTVETGSSSNTCTIFWWEGPIVGKAKFTPSAGFTCQREVNIVQVKIKNDTTNRIIYTSDPPVQDSSFPSLIRSASPPPAIVARVTIEKIEGPTVNGGMRGVKFIQMGFIQNGSLTRKHADYFGFTPGRRRLSSLEGATFYLDLVTNPSVSTIPWYDSSSLLSESSTVAFLSPTSDGQLIDQRFTTRDTPNLLSTDTMSLTVGTVTSSVDRFALEFDLNLYFAVRTTEAANGSQNLYTQRGSASFEFDGSGNIASGIWTQTGAGTTGAASFTVMSTGSRVPVTTIPILNNLLTSGETWSTTTIP
jgi:hypothetical protein